MGILCPISRFEDGLFEGFDVLSLRSKHETEHSDVPRETRLRFEGRANVIGGLREWYDSRLTAKESALKQFMFLHFGFEKPTPEIMKAWQAWFASIAEAQIGQGGFNGGKEISKAGTSDLAWNLDSITGYNIIEAEDMAAAEKLAQSNPFISSIRIYELRTM
jgi:hypothetical protein